jgi:uncharacterized membrane protein (DUF4010 family)
MDFFLRLGIEPVFVQLGLAVLLGLLVGLQREHAASGAAGLRTFPLITALGTVAAILDRGCGASGWVLAAALLGVAAVVALAHGWRPQEDEGRRGTTTDFAMLLMFGVGALLTVEHMAEAAMAVGGGVAVLLQFKPELHRLVRKLGDDDLRAIMQFVLITCIILPVLPDQPLDPYGVLRPAEIWLMVVLIVGLGLAGYVAHKFFGAGAGILLGGVLGGTVSSTATTASYARTVRGQPQAIPAAAAVIVIASTVMYVRLLIMLAVVSREFFFRAALPLGLLAVATLLPGLALWFGAFRAARRLEAAPAPGPLEQSNPSQLKSAVFFGLTYAAVLLGLAVAKEHIGEQAVYVVAAVSGLTDVDALTLSTARMAATDAAILEDGWRLIVVGTLSNFVAKAAIAGLLGGWAFFRRMALLFLVPLLSGLALLATL